MITIETRKEDMTTSNLKMIEIETHAEAMRCCDASGNSKEVPPHTDDVRIPDYALHSREKTRWKCIIDSTMPQWQIIEGRI